MLDKDSRKGLIFNIQKLCLDDGPGIRTTVFLKGCPLKCAWCHQIIGDGERLIHQLDLISCINCKVCLKVCHKKALKTCGKEVSVEEVMKDVLIDKSFYKASGGGITLSGGEPLWQSEFARELLIKAKKEGLHTCVETSGGVSSDTIEQVAPYVDYFLFDIKETNEENHKKYIGISKESIQANLKKLNALDKTILIRCPIIPGVNDRQDHFDALVCLYHSLKNVIGIQLMPYHQLGKVIKGKRDQVILSTKCRLWWHDERGSKFFEQSGYDVRHCLEPDTIKKELELSLTRLDTDYIDIYFTHWQAVPPHMTEISKTMACLMDLKTQGLIKSIGVSNVTQEHIEEYLKYGELDVIQEKYSMLDRKLENTLAGCCEKNKLAIRTYSSLEQGLLTGKIGMDYVLDPKEARADIPWYALNQRAKVLEMLDSWEDLTKKHQCTLAQRVIAWTMAQKNMTYVLSGAREPEQTVDTAHAAKIVLSKEDIQLMNDAIFKIGD